MLCRQKVTLYRNFSAIFKLGKIVSISKFDFLKMEKAGVKDFYTGKYVFLTGATGFLGKAVLEKLLRSCSEVSTVYILVRQKPGSSSDVHTRVQTLLESPLFETLKAIENGKVLKKIHPIEGDIGVPSLGISLRDRTLLTAKVSVVIHSAATIKFDAYLSDAVNLNVNGLRRVIQLCREMKHLKSFVHISTAFANCDRKFIEEKVYPSPDGSAELIEFLCQSNNRSDNDEMSLATISIDFKKSRPNTYTFTKAVAEHILSLEARDLPVCIVRPSIVTVAWKEPIQGWIDNINGPTGIFAAAGLGVLRTMIADSGNVIDLIPVDVVANLILCAAWETSFKEKYDPIKVYNCCQSRENPLLLGKLPDLLRENFRNLVPFSKVVFYPDFTMTTNRLVYSLIDFFVQYLPAFCMDLFCSENSNSFLKMYHKLKKATASLEFFSLNEWTYVTDNSTILFNSLNKEDKQYFYFDVNEIDWTEYMKIYSSGIRKYIMKDEDETLHLARKRIERLGTYYFLLELMVLFIGAFIVLVLI